MTQFFYIMIMLLSGHGETGRRVRLRGVWATIWVQVPVTAPDNTADNLRRYFFVKTKFFAKYKITS